MDVGIRELKQNLSRYIDSVAHGETVRVTDRGVPRALLVPLSVQGQLRTGIDEGWIRPASGIGLNPFRGASAARQMLDVLADDREE